MSRNRTAGRLEGTHAFPLNHVPEPRTHGRFLNQIDVTMEERGEHLSELFQPAKMIEPSGRNPTLGRIAKSTSDASVASPRANEPNSVIVFTPCALSSAS